jgi:hypothetical protein
MVKTKYKRIWSIALGMLALFTAASIAPHAHADIEWTFGQVLGVSS